MHPSELSTLPELVAWRAEREGDQSLYSFLDESGSEEGVLTYRGLAESACAIATVLSDTVAPGERAVLLYPPGLQYISGFFGCLHAGVVAVPAYPPDPSRLERTLPRLRAIIQDSQATVVLTNSFILGMTEFLFEQAPDLAKLRWFATDEVRASSGKSWRAPALTRDSLAFLQYTSGSTGTPKGVMLSQGNLLHNLEQVRRKMGLTTGTVGVFWLPPYHDMGLIGGILAPLYTGARNTALMSPITFLKTPLRWLEAISRYRGTLSGAPNFAFDLCVRKSTPEQRAALDLRSWEVAFSGAEPIRPETLERFAEAFAPSGFRHEALYPCYGLAEGTLIVSGGAVRERPILCALDASALEYQQVIPAEQGAPGTRVLVSSGRTLDDQDIGIVDPETRVPCAPGRVGEIWVRSPSVAQGYWNRPEETEQTFRARLATTGEGPFLRTGDLGFLANGELFISTRLKDLIIIRGRNHYPQDIEHTVGQSHTALRPGCTAAFSVEEGGEEHLVVVQEVDPRKVTAPEELVKTVRREVATQHELRLHALVLLAPGSIHKTTSGKIQRRACKASFMAGELQVVHAWREDWTSQEQGAAEVLSASASEGVPSTEEELEAWLLERLHTRLRVKPGSFSATEPIIRLGLDSLAAVELSQQFEAQLGVPLQMTALLDGSSTRELARHLMAKRAARDTVVLQAIQRCLEVGDVPLSFAQQRLWFLDQMQPGSATYNIPAALLLRGPLDCHALGLAFDEIVRRHEALRTTFLPSAQGASQHISSASAPVLSRVDLSHLPLEERLPHAQHMASQEALRPFNLATGPLFRASLLSLEPERHVLLLTMHHIVSDGWSLGVLIQELSALYEAFRHARPSPLPALPIQYTDFSVWQREALQGPALDSQLQWWLSYLAGAPQALELPTDKPRPPVQSFRGANFHFSLPRPLVDQLRALSQQQEVTLFMTLLAAFQVLLNRYSGQEDICVGTPVAGRGRPETESLIGFFVNTLVLRTRLSGELSFRALLQRVRESTLGAFAHQELPFEKLVDALQPARDLSRSPLFQVMFTLQSNLLPNLKMQDISVSRLPAENEASKFDLTLFLTETEEGMEGTFEYSTDLFEPATLTRMASHLGTLLQAIVSNPDCSLRELPLLSDSERHLLLSAWAGPSADFPLHSCFHHLFAAQVARTPDSIAVSDDSQSLSYLQLHLRSNRLAHHLVSLGVGPDSVISLLAPRGVDFLTCVLAIFKAGGAYLPLDPLHPPQRLAHVLSQSASPLLLASSSLHQPVSSALDALPSSSRPRLLLLEDILASDGPTEDLPPRASPSHLAYVIFTSGSTGSPKGAMVEHRGMLNHLFAKVHQLSLVSSDVVAQTASQCFDISVWQFLAALLVGARTHVLPDEVAHHPTRLLGSLPLHSISLLETVPSLLRAMLEEFEASTSRPSLSGLRWMIPTGEALPPELCRRWFALFPSIPLLNAYGPTECSDDVTHFVLRSPPSSANTPIGRPIPNMRLYVLDSSLELVPIGVPGELFVGGVGVGRGYLNDVSRTSSSFLSDPFSSSPHSRLYRTGDLVRWLPDGNLEFLGRLDHQVKVRGFRIELGEIEAALSQLGSLKHAVVLAREDVPGHKRLVAYVVPAPGHTFDASALRAALKQHLPEYMLPSAFVPLEALPLSPNGKVDRKALPPPGAALLSLEDSFVPPRNSIESSLARIWQEVLGSERVGIHDNFFSLGGHSLLATQITSRISRDLQVELPLRDLFEHPTIASLALRIIQNQVQQEDPAVLEQAMAALEGISEQEALRLLSSSDTNTSQGNDSHD